jgi:phosphonate transport system ATP-binding protein
VSQPLFELAGANVGYGDGPVLRDVTLRIVRGERVAVVGRSGAGKSTLLAHLYSSRRDEAALIPQDFALVRPLSVFHNVYMGRLHRRSALYNLVNLVRPQRREVAAVRALLEGLGLADKLATPVAELSGGQQQRTAVARALFQGADVVLGDEPVSAVDTLQGRELLAAIRAAFPTMVLAMHDVELALGFAERVIGLKDGRIVLDRQSAGLGPKDLDWLYR